MHMDDRCFVIYWLLTIFMWNIINWTNIEMQFWCNIKEKVEYALRAKNANFLRFR